MPTIKLFIILGVIFVAVFFITLFSGFINIAATNPDPPPMDWVLSSGMKSSVRFHARGVKAPDLKARRMITSGEEFYQGLCALCHGGPDADAAPSSLGQGLNPPAPTMNNEPAKWTGAQIYWIVKNGIKMTGMPSFGNSHDSSDLWDIVAYIVKMPSLSSDKTHASDTPARSVDSATKAASSSDQGIGPIKMVPLRPIDQKLSNTGLKIFNRSCTSCHLLDAPISGPALRSEVSSRSPEFIMNMLVNTAEMEAKDPIVKESIHRYGDSEMPATGLDSAKARAVLEYLRTAAAGN
jgi:mono/diheme cytochrome c family protein